METLKTTEKDLLADCGGIAGMFRIDRPQTRLENVVLEPSELTRLKAFLDNSAAIRDCRHAFRLDETIDYGCSTLILLHGPTGTGKTMTARAMANHTARPLVTFQSGNNHRSGYGFDERLDAFLSTLESHNAIGLMDECHGYLGEDDDELAVFLTEIEKRDVTLFIATTAPETLGPALDRRISFKLAMTQPDVNQRLRIWTNLLPPAVTTAPDVELATLATAYNLNGGYIKNAILFALNLAIHRDPAHVVLQMDDLVTAARLQEKATGAGMRIRTVLQPRIRLADLCLNDGDRTAAERMASRIERCRIENANILVACAGDTVRATNTALALAGSAEATVSRIEAGLLLDGDMLRGRYDTVTILRQALSAAYESGHVMMICGLQEHLPAAHNDLCAFDARLIRVLIDHPGRKLLVVDDPTRITALYPNDVLDTLDLQLPCNDTRRKHWQKTLETAGETLPPGTPLEQLAAIDLTENGMRLVLNRARWMAAGNGHVSLTLNHLLEAATYVTGRSGDGAPMFG